MTEQPLSNDEINRGLEAWKMAVTVQQHFNDIEMRIRNYALTLLVAVLAGAGLALREHETIRLFGWDVSLASVILLAGLVAWLSFWAMDEAWYHRLLIGAVVHAIALEKELAPHVPGIGLSQRIGDESVIYLNRWKRRKEGRPKRNGTPRKAGEPREIHSTNKIRFFYLVIGTVLLLFALAVQLSEPAAEPGVPSAQSPVASP